MEECLNCVHSELMISNHKDDGPLLKCLRYPPVVIRMRNELVQVNPDANNKCGEYQEQIVSGHRTWTSSTKLVVRLFKKGY